MKKILGLLVFILLCVLVGCSSANEGIIDDGNHNQPSTVLLNNVVERKIIYSVDAKFNVIHIEPAVDDVLARLENDEWVDFQSIRSNYASLVVRVKTARLDDFMQGIRQTYVLTNYEKIAKDISLQYQDKSNRILSIQAQITRLLELYENASLSEMIVINQQLSDLEIELQRLNGEIASFDSLIDYSEISITMYGNRVVTRSPFINRIGQAFVNGSTGLVMFLDGLIIVIVTILPFAITFGGIGTGVYLYIKHINKKRDLKKEKKDI